MFHLNCLAASRAASARSGQQQRAEPDSRRGFDLIEAGARGTRSAEQGAELTFGAGLRKDCFQHLAATVVIEKLVIIVGVVIACLFECSCTFPPLCCRSELSSSLLDCLRLFLVLESDPSEPAVSAASH